MKRILIVDDSETARMFIRKCLEIAGEREAEFLEAGNGTEALSLLESSQVDLIVTDLNMPGMDGMELLWHVRARKDWKKPPVLVITSAKNPAREAELLSLGASAVLAKPISPAILAREISAIEKP